MGAAAAIRRGQRLAVMAAGRLSDVGRGAARRGVDRAARSRPRAAVFNSEELRELARQQRSLARVTDSAGRRRELLALADRYERAAQNRAAIRG